MEFGTLSRAQKLLQIKRKHYDIVIIGGGVFGACALREASLRGLNALLVESEDFASGASANSFKIVHGGIRYLQHLDLVRLRSSCRERSSFLRVAPHLVEPLPIVVPTYGMGLLGKPILGLGMLLYDILTIGRNKGFKDHNRRIPLTEFLNREQVLDEFPGIPKSGLTGACVFNDGRFYNPTRLVWAFVKTAMSRGAHALNYLAACDLKVVEGQISGLHVKDMKTGELFDVDCKSILNTAGPWAEHFLSASKVSNVKAPAATYSRDACLVIKRKPTSRYTLAVQGQTSDPDAMVSRPARHLFVSPWRDSTLIGVWHVVTKVNPSEVTVGEDEIEGFINEINKSLPDFDLKMNEVSLWNAGLVPFGENEEGSENLSYGKRSLLIDHEQTENIKGLVTLVGIRYTMARDEAERALDIMQRKLGQSPSNIKSDFIPVDGANFSIFDELVKEIATSGGAALNANTIVSLAHNYGSEYACVLDIIKADPSNARVFDNTTVTVAEVLHCLGNEMVENFSDLIFRRTDAATAGNPGENTLADMLDIMSREYAWSDAEKSVQLSRAVKEFPRWQR